MHSVIYFNCFQSKIYISHATQQINCISPSLQLHDKYKTGCPSNTHIKEELTDIMVEYTKEVRLNDWDDRVGDTQEITEEHCGWQVVPAFIFCISIVTTIGEH